MCAKLRTVATSNNRDHPTRSLYYWVFTPPTVYRGVVLRAHSVCGKSRIQSNASGEIATTSPPFCKEPNRSHVLFVKVSHGTTFKYRSQNHFVAIGELEQQVRKASLCTVAASNNRDHPTRSCYYCFFAPYIYGCCSSRTFRSW